MKLRNALIGYDRLAVGFDGGVLVLVEAAITPLNKRKKVRK